MITIGLDTTNGLHINPDHDYSTNIVGIDDMIEALSNLKDHEYLIATLDKDELKELKKHCISYGYAFPLK